MTSFDFMECDSKRAMDKEIGRHWLEGNAEAKYRGKRLITHKTSKWTTDEDGYRTFSTLTVLDYETGENIAEYDRDDIEHANRDYERYDWYHATFYTP